MRATTYNLISNQNKGQRDEDECRTRQIINNTLFECKPFFDKRLNEADGEQRNCQSYG
jgi:hypothetical protein